MNIRRCLASRLCLSRAFQRCLRICGKHFLLWAPQVDSRLSFARGTSDPSTRWRDRHPINRSTPTIYGRVAQGCAPEPKAAHTSMRYEVEDERSVSQFDVIVVLRFGKHFVVAVQDLTHPLESTSFAKPDRGVLFFSPAHAQQIAIRLIDRPLNGMTNVAFGR